MKYLSNQIWLTNCKNNSGIAYENILNVPHKMSNKQIDYTHRYTDKHIFLIAQNCRDQIHIRRGNVNSYKLKQTWWHRKRPIAMFVIHYIYVSVTFYCLCVTWKYTLPIVMSMILWQVVLLKFCSQWMHKNTNYRPTLLYLIWTIASPVFRLWWAHSVCTESLQAITLCR